MSVEVAKCFLVDTVNPVKFLAPDFELDARLSQVPIELAMEVPSIDH